MKMGPEPFAQRSPQGFIWKLPQKLMIPRYTMNPRMQPKMRYEPTVQKYTTMPNVKSLGRPAAIM